MNTENKDMQSVTPALNMSTRFTNKVLSEFSGSAGEVQITTYQRALIQGYFIGIDRALNMYEEDRMRRNASNKDRKFDNPLPATWANVNLPELARDVVHFARLGLDMMQPNHISPIPFRNRKTDKYDVTLIPGYNGIRYVAENYALVKPKSVTIELVYSTDKFQPFKKSRNNPVESFEFEITNAFDRGDIVGGFGYIEYDDPGKNELVIMTMKDIMKRKPQYASANFWGGTVSEWNNGKKSEVEKDGWLEEMCRKTLIREVYSAKHIPRDPRKVDESYQYMKQQEARLEEAAQEMRQERNVTANTIPIEAAVEEVPDKETPAALSMAQTETSGTKETPAAAANEQETEEDLSYLFDAPDTTKGEPEKDGPTF